ncbi:uncharacterized protein [Periplaneta americana]|uniref:uncharacterized protein n=1 Tax=Periplaneta americana TaxID=6978 RepID=UPI0037E8A77A
MKLLAVGLACVAVLAVVHARPRFIAIPLDDVQFVEVADFDAAPLVRVARQAGFQARDSDVDAEESGRFQRGAHGGDAHDYVDYGAHTGHHGAFGWYADFPVHKGH